MSILLDAGPTLNFLAVGQENILIQAAASQSVQLAAPARIDTEITGMARSPRFERTRVKTTWATLKASHRLETLLDELTTQQFTDAVTRISGMQAQERVRDKKSLGESDGRQRAGKEARWLREQRYSSILTLRSRWGRACV